MQCKAPSNVIGYHLHKVMIRIRGNYSDVLFFIHWTKINKKDLRKRCELGNESGIKNELVGVLEMVEACKKNLALIGPTALEISEYDHIRCDQGIELGSYLNCVTENKDWRPPSGFKNLMKVALHYFAHFLRTVNYNSKRPYSKIDNWSTTKYESKKRPKLPLVCTE